MLPEAAAAGRVRCSAGLGVIAEAEWTGARRLCRGHPSLIRLRIGSWTLLRPIPIPSCSFRHTSTAPDPDRAGYSINKKVNEQSIECIFFKILLIHESGLFYLSFIAWIGFCHFSFINFLHKFLTEMSRQSMLGEITNPKAGQEPDKDKDCLLDSIAAHFRTSLALEFWKTLSRPLGRSPMFRPSLTGSARPGAIPIGQALPALLPSHRASPQTPGFGCCPRRTRRGRSGLLASSRVPARLWAAMRWQ